MSMAREAWVMDSGPRVHLDPQVPFLPALFWLPTEPPLKPDIQLRT